MNGRDRSRSRLGPVVTRYRYRDADGSRSHEHRYIDKSFPGAPWPGRATRTAASAMSNCRACIGWTRSPNGPRRTARSSCSRARRTPNGCGRWAIAATCTPYGATWPVDGVVEFVAGLDVPVHVIRDKDDKGYAWAAGLRRDLTAAGGRGQGLRDAAGPQGRRRLRSSRRRTRAHPTDGRHSDPRRRNRNTSMRNVSWRGRGRFQREPLPTTMAPNCCRRRPSRWRSRVSSCTISTATVC